MNVDDFVVSDDRKIKWSSSLKQKLQRGKSLNFQKQKFDNLSIVPLRNQIFILIPNDERESGAVSHPSSQTLRQKRKIECNRCDHGLRSGFNTLMANLIPDFTHSRQVTAFNASPSTPTMRTGQIAVRISPIGRWNTSARIMKMTQSPNGTYFIMFTVCSTIQNTGSGIKRISNGNCRVSHSHRTFGVLPKQGSDYRKSTSATRTCPNIGSRSSKHPICRSTGAWKRCGCPKTKRRLCTTIS